MEIKLPKIPEIFRSKEGFIVFFVNAMNIGRKIKGNRVSVNKKI
ncbi:MAG: hypothetical protein ACRCVJ_18590 [Clostridium sp.]